MESSSLNKKIQYMSEKKFAKSLSRLKMVYARDEDPDNTLIIRDFYNEADRVKCVGVKGIDDINKLILSILKLMDTEREMIENVTRFVDADTLTTLYERFDELKESEKERLQLLPISISQTKGGVKTMKMIGFPKSNASVIVSLLTANGKQPQISIGNAGQNSVYLFVGEAVKLLHYMERRFNINLCIDKRMNSDDFF